MQSASQNPARAVDVRAPFAPPSPATAFTLVEERTNPLAAAVPSEWKLAAARMESAFSSVRWSSLS
jgi:hypothetical protein